jgi:oxamate amidohydrolase
MMQQTFHRGIAVAPHADAAATAVHLLREGANAIEAMIGAAATIAVAYPHMTAIGGDAFWLIHEPGKPPIAIDACGAAAKSASIDLYRDRGYAAMPTRGALAANTVAGTVSGWDAALTVSRAWGGRLPLSALLERAIVAARTGIAVTASQAASTAAKLDELRDQPGFADQFLVDGKSPAAGSAFTLPRLAETLAHLANAGLPDFYRGELADSIARDFAKLGGLISFDDLRRHEAVYREPLSRTYAAGAHAAGTHAEGTLYNMTPPTQGAVSLLILAILDRLDQRGPQRLRDLDPCGADYVHRCVEATKQAFSIRDKYLTDPSEMTVHPQSLLDDDIVAALASRVQPARAAPWGMRLTPADTVWMGVIDGEGRAVSFIQSIYHEFGAGIVLPESGINWQNRGASFSLDPKALLALKPGKKPFHTLNPALMLFADGRVMPYGTMGGDGQPQTQAAVFTRIALHGMTPQAAIDAPRWVLGRTWGAATDSLKLERRFSEAVFMELKARGHDVEWLREWDESVGHAGALVRAPDGAMTGGYDRRSDGAVLGL